MVINFTIRNHQLAIHFTLTQANHRHLATDFFAELAVGNAVFFQQATAVFALARRFGFRFGLVTDFQLGANANYFFSTGLFLNTLGSKSVVTTALTVFDSLPALSVATNVQSKFQYVELPISIKLKTNEIGYMTYFGQLGFDVGVLTGAKAKVDAGDFEDVKDDVFPMRVALAVGGGLEYNFSGNTSALIGIKYSNSFMNLYQNGRVGGMSMKESFFGGKLQVIRPLLMVEKKYIAKAVAQWELPLWSNPCPSANTTRRHDVLQDLQSICKDHKSRKTNVFNGLVRWQFEKHKKTLPDT